MFLEWLRACGVRALFPVVKSCPTTQPPLKLKGVLPNFIFKFILHLGLPKNTWFTMVASGFTLARLDIRTLPSITTRNAVQILESEMPNGLLRQGYRQRGFPTICFGEGGSPHSTGRRNSVHKLRLARNFHILAIQFDIIHARKFYSDSYTRFYSIGQKVIVLGHLWISTSVFSPKSR